MAVSRWEICKGCIYSFCYGDGWGCAYHVITGQWRHLICKSGPGCTVRKGEPEPELKPERQVRQLQRRTASWDTDAAMALYEQGKSLDEIARAVGAGRDLVRSFFSNRGMKFPDTRKHRRWDTERAAEMRRNGATFKDIAQAVGVARGTVEKYLAEHGVVPLDNEPDVDEIVNLCQQGKSVAEIARALKTDRLLVRRHLEECGLTACGKRKKAPDAQASGVKEEVT